MNRSEKAIFTNMCMIYDGQGNILVQNRINKNWPGLTFPGGHVERGESFTESVKREILEETGLSIYQPKLCGIKQFQTLEDERYVVLLFKTAQYEGQLQSSEEGEVFWIPRDTLRNYTLASDFEEMIKVFEKDELSEMYYSSDEKIPEGLLL